MTISSNSMVTRPSLHIEPWVNVH